MHSLHDARRLAHRFAAASILFVSLPLAGSAAITKFACFGFQQQEQHQQTAVSKLSSVLVTGSSRYSSEQIAPFTGLAEGETVGRETLQQGADRLAALGCFSSVQYKFSSQGDEVSVEFQVADAPAAPALFDNFPWFSDEEIAAAIRTNVGFFDGSVPTHGTLLDSISDALTKMLAAHTISGTIQHQLTAMPDGEQQVMRFTVGGPAVTVSGVQFSDPLAQNDQGLAGVLTDVVGKPYSRLTIQVFNFEQVRPLYLRHGFLHVKFGAAQAKLAGDAKQGAMVVVTDPIDPGPAYLWGGATWKGNSAIPGAQLDALLPLHSGDVADGMKIAGGWEAVRAQYGAAGYLDTVVEPVETFDNDHKVAVYSVKITEGPQYHMGNLVLTGLSLAAERLIRAAWKVNPDAPFDLSYFNEFLATGARQALSPLPVHIDQIGHFLKTNPKDGTVDVMLDFQ